MAYAFRTTSARVFALPDAECQGIFLPDDECHNLWRPDDACHGICLLDGECQGIVLPDDGYYFSRRVSKHLPEGHCARHAAHNARCEVAHAYAY